MKKKTFRLIAFAIFIVGMVVITLMAIPFIKSIKEPDAFKEFVDSFDAPGVVIMLLVQVFQIVVALIPGEFVEFFAGSLYGCFGGLFLCLSGIALGQMAVFGLVRFFGRDFVESFAGSRAFEKLKFLRDEKKLRIIVFLLFFIPGTPKDILCYVVPFTSMKLREFIPLTLVARIPSVITSTYAGSAFAEQNYVVLVIAYASIFLAWAVGYFGYRYFESSHKSSDKE